MGYIVRYDDGDTLCHYGVKGMKWYVRRAKEVLDRLAGRTRPKKDSKGDSSDDADDGGGQHKTSSSTSSSSSSPAPSSSKSVKKMSDQELRERIERLQMEKRYAALTADPVEKQKILDGRKIVSDILTQSIETVGKGTLTYALGKGVNKVTKRQIFKDKG